MKGNSTVYWFKTEENVVLAFKSIFRQIKWIIVVYIEGGFEYWAMSPKKKIQKY